VVEHIGNMVVTKVIYVIKKQNFTLCPLLQGVKTHINFEIFKGKAMKSMCFLNYK